MNRNRKTICLVIHSLQGGGMERVMAELANYFSKRENINLHLVLYGIKRDIFYPLPDSVFIHKPSFPFNDKRRLLSTIKTIYFLRNKINEIRPNSILSFGEYWNSFVLLATLGLPFPVFVSDRSQPDKRLGGINDKMRKWLYPFAKGIIAQTDKAKQVFKSMYKHSNIIVIGNPIREIENSAGLNERENIVLMVGRLIKTKHQDKLIEMFVHINMPGWKLVIVGHDHLKQKNMGKLLSLINELNAADKVTLAGTQAEVERFYLQSKIFAFTSSSEGFPNVIGEAMSAGLPVVAFDCVAGPSDMITDGKDGFLVPLYDYEMFTKKLKDLMENESLRNNLGASAKVSIKKFFVDTIGASYEAFILK